MQELGQGNAAAVSVISKLFANSVPSDPNSAPESMLSFLSALPSRMQTDPDLQAAFGGITLNGIVESAKQKIVDEAVSNFTKAIPQLAAKFVPGAGAVLSIVNGLQWILNNQGAMQDLFNAFVNQTSLNAIASNQPEVLATQLVNAFNAAAPLTLGFIASQVGRGSLPGQIQKTLGFIPKQVDDALRKAIRSIVGKLKTGPIALPTNTPAGMPNPTPPAGMFDGAATATDGLMETGTSFDWETWYECGAFRAEVEARLNRR